MKQTNINLWKNHGYLHIRIFSGIIYTPAGKEPVDYWLERATMMVEGSDCSENEKRHRIIESLRGPAPEISRNFRFSKPYAIHHKNIFAINRAFGTRESGEDLYFAFLLH